MSEERGRDSLGGGNCLYFWIELIHELASHVRNVGDYRTVKEYRCEGVGANCRVGAVLKVAIFNIIFLCGLL